MNTVSVAQEHLATATAQTLLVQLFAAQEPVAPCGRRFLLACVEGNHHALGLRMVADAFELGGWDVACLGANMPARYIAGMTEQVKPELVGLSVSLPQHLRAARQTAATLRST